MIVSVNDWNLHLRFYEIEEEKFTEMMSLLRNDRRKFFNKNTKMAKVHCDSDADWHPPPIYTNRDEEWDEFEEEWNNDC